MKSIQVKAEIQIPKVPNFIKGSGNTKYPVSSFDDATLDQIGAAWTVNLKSRAAQMKTEKK